MTSSTSDLSRYLRGDTTRPLRLRFRLAILATHLLWAGCGTADEPGLSLDASLDAKSESDTADRSEVDFQSTDAIADDAFTLSTFCRAICKIASQVVCSQTRTPAECEQLCVNGAEQCPNEANRLNQCVASLRVEDFVCDAVRGLPKPDPKYCQGERQALSTCELNALLSSLP